MERKIKTSELIKRFAPYYKKYMGILFMDLFCASLTTVCEIVLPLILPAVCFLLFDRYLIINF